MKSRESVVQYLRGLGDKEFAELFYDVVRARPMSDVKEARRHLVLADAALEDGKWTVDLIAREDPAEYKAGWASDVSVCQSGECGTCGSGVRSWAKHMICPVCESKAYGS